MAQSRMENCFSSSEESDYLDLETPKGTLKESERSYFETTKRGWEQGLQRILY